MPAIVIIIACARTQRVHGRRPHLVQVAQLAQLGLGVNGDLAICALREEGKGDKTKWNISRELVTAIFLLTMTMRGGYRRTANSAQRRERTCFFTASALAAEEPLPLELEDAMPPAELEARAALLAPPSADADALLLLLRLAREPAEPPTDAPANQEHMRYEGKKVVRIKEGR